MSARKRRIKRKPDPFPASRWQPLAIKHGMSICYETKTVSTRPSGHFIIDWWGSKELPTLGACVFSIARRMS